LILLRTSAVHKKGKAMLDRLHHRLTEALTDLWSTFVDPAEPFFDDGQRWSPLGPFSGASRRGDCDLANESQLADIRNECRRLAIENEFAINGHENRISYIVGPGHTYRAMPAAVEKSDAAAGLKVKESKGRKDSSTLALLDFSTVAAVQRLIDEFVVTNHWHRRQQEIVRRRDRDGEAFLQFFTAADGSLRIRFIEPDQIYTPPDQSANAAARLGILTERDDVETVLGYFVDGRLIDAAEIQHRKANVDGNVRRGLPLFYPVRKNLRRAEKLLRNMSVVAEIQSAIALIRKHRSATATGVQQFVMDQTSASPPLTPRPSALVRRYAPGTILDAQAGIEYDFPAAGIDAANFVGVLQAELRAIASRLVMPEFMLSSDASNANYASTMVAEGPAMRMFERLQAEQVEDDLSVMWRVVDAAIAAGRLPPEARSVVEIQAVPPSLAVRDQLKEAQRRKIENAAGILSPQTWSQQSGLDYDQEQSNFKSHQPN
jgi:capsid protein